jgi:hypothetical protein
MGEDGRNGSRPHIDDFGVEDHNMDAKAAAAIAARVARRQALADDDIDELEVLVGRLVKGETAWQQTQTRLMHSVVFKVNQLLVARVAVPGILLCLIVFLGSATGMILYRLATSH